MKTRILILFLFVGLAALAQDRLEDFRIVNGQLYNIKRSVKWEDLAAGNDFDDSYTVLVVKRIFKDGSLDCDHETYTRQAGEGMTLASITPLCLKNYPLRVFIGSKITRCRAMKLLNNAGDTFNTYDFGLPNTPANRNKKIQTP